MQHLAGLGQAHQRHADGIRALVKQLGWATCAPQTGLIKLQIQTLPTPAWFNPDSYGGWVASCGGPFFSAAPHESLTVGG
ncbi:MAG: hypothetical protein GY796_07915 [Chloroflexi bacterium]|nr:hypothetical protein [Chloroflexota bacterium]